MLDKEVHDEVVKWLKLVTGVTVIKAFQGGDDPAWPYIVVNRTTQREVRTNEEEIEWKTLDTSNSQGKLEEKATPIVEVEWMFSIHAYAENSTDLLRPIVSAQKLSQVTEPLLPRLTVHELSAIRNVPDFINNEWRDRAQMDMFVRGLTRDGFIVDTIEEYSFEFERTN